MPRAPSSRDQGLAASLAAEYGARVVTEESLGPVTRSHLRRFGEARARGAESEVRALLAEAEDLLSLMYAANHVDACADERRTSRYAPRPQRFEGARRR